MQETKTETAGFRLSPQQQQLLASEAPPGAVQCLVALEGPVDLERLRSALQSVAARHEILRTTFSRPVGMRTHQQVINAESLPTFSLESGLGAADLPADAAALRQLMSREAEREFDLARGPLLRALLLDGEPTVLLLSACAACVDVASLMLLLDELCASYRGETLAAEPVQYADYAEWRHELISDVQEPGAQEGLAFWREDVADRPLPPRILFALPEGRDGTRMASAPLELHGIDREELQRVGVAVGVTAAVFLEAAWHALLARMSGA